MSIRDLIKIVFMEAQKGGGYTKETEDYFYNKYAAQSAPKQSAGVEQAAKKYVVDNLIPKGLLDLSLSEKEIFIEKFLMSSIDVFKAGAEWQYQQTCIALQKKLKNGN